MEEKKISVIIPVYNAEKTLDRCLLSVCDQTYKNLEIIVINDGSYDFSLSKLESWRKKDYRIKIVDKPNGGASSARNAGLNIAEGDYISFVDADDFLENELYEKLECLLSQHDADVASSAINEIYADDITVHQSNSDFSPLISGLDALCCMLTYSGGIRTVVWDKLYKRSAVENIYFEEAYKYCEDALFNFKVLLNCKRYCRSIYTGYTYDHRKSGVTGSVSYDRSRLSNIHASQDMMRILNTELKERCTHSDIEKLKKSLYIFQLNLYRQMFQILLLQPAFQGLNKADYETIKSAAKKIDKKTISKQLNFREKLQWFLYLNCPSLFIVIHKVNHMRGEV